MRRQTPSLTSAHATAKRVEHLFVIRVWLEAGGSVTWRGMAQHIATGERIYFVSMRDLDEFLRSRMVIPGASAIPPAAPDVCD